MVAWALAIAGCAAGGIAAVMLVRRELVFQSWLRTELGDLRDEVDRTCFEIRGESTFSAAKALDECEGDEEEIASNLDRMNVLLDQLNGLIRGRGNDSHRRSFPGEGEPLDMALDFTSPEELERFGALPPISEEEVRSIDWDYLLNRLGSEDLHEGHGT